MKYPDHDRGDNSSDRVDVGDDKPLLNEDAVVLVLVVSSSRVSILFRHEEEEGVSSWSLLVLFGLCRFAR